MKVKICGITRVQDAQACDMLGVDYIGFNFWKPSKRYIKPDDARTIIGLLKKTKPVAVFVEKDQEYIKKIVGQTIFAGIQLHTDSSPFFCNRIKKLFPDHIIIQAFRIRDCLPDHLDDFNADYFLFDALSGLDMGGTGTSFDWNILNRVKSFSDRVFIAGGINPENIEHLLSIIQPFGVDVASGVEISPGIKDIEKIRLLMAKIKKGKDE